MAVILGYNIPYMGYIGSGVGLVIGAIILWSVLRSRGESRIDIANEEIERDEELIKLHRREKKIEKTERTDAEELLRLFNQFYYHARALGLHQEQQEGRATLIKSRLGSIIAERMDMKSEFAEFNNLSGEILYYITHFNSGDKIINFYKSPIETALAKLGVDIRAEYAAIEQTRRVLDEEEEDTHREEAA